MNGDAGEGREVNQAGAWVVAALVPALCGVDWVAAIAWSGALLVGALVAGRDAFQRPLRWLAVGWIASAAVPGLPLVAVAAAGTIGLAWATSAVAAAVGSPLAAVLPPRFRSAGLLLLFAGLLLLGSARLRRPPESEDTA